MFRAILARALQQIVKFACALDASAARRRRTGCFENRDTLDVTPHSVRDLRMHRDMSQEELAAEAGMHWTYVGQVERGKRNVTLFKIVQFAEALGVEPAALLATDLPKGVSPAPPGKVRPGGRRRPPKPRGR